MSGKPKPLTRSEFQELAKVIAARCPEGTVSALQETIEAGGFAVDQPTPGPWRVRGDQYGSIVADMPGPDDRPGHPDYYDGAILVAEGVQPHNAHLIAAAPELLDALENLENDDGSIPAPAWEMCQYAIARARGRV